MNDWKEGYLYDPPHRVLLEMIRKDNFDPNDGPEIGYATTDDGEVRWYTLHRYLGRTCDHCCPTWWRVCPTPSEALQSESDAFSTLTRELLENSQSFAMCPRREA